MIRPSAFLFAVVPCLGNLDCSSTSALNLHEYSVAPQTQGEAIAVGAGFGVPAAGGVVSTGYGPFEVVVRRVMRKSVGDSVAREIEYSCGAYAQESLTQLSEHAVVGVFAADAIVGFAAAGGIALLLNHMWHYHDYEKLTSNAKLAVDSLQDAYETLFKAFLHLPHPLSLLESQADGALLCRWKEAANSMNQKVLDAQAAIRDAQAYINDCWFWCDTPIPSIVMVDMQHVESKVEDLNFVFDGFLDCYPSCAGDVMSSSWDSIADDAFHICNNVHKATCDFPDNAEWCHAVLHHPCTRWGSTSGTVILIETYNVSSMPPTMQDGTALMLVEADSCGRTQHTVHDLKQLVRCTQALFATQERDLVNQQQQVSYIFNVAFVVVMVSWFAIICRGDDSAGYSDMQEAGPRAPRHHRSRDANRHSDMSDANVYRTEGLRSRGDNRYTDMSDANVYTDMGDANLICKSAKHAAAQYCPPLLLSVSMLAVGIAVASKWALDTNVEMIQAVSLWLNTIRDDLDDLPQNLALTNFSLLANDVSTAVSMPILRGWQSPLSPVQI